MTGGAGRLGTQVSRMLASSGAEVRAFDLPQADFAHVEGVEGVTVVKGDLTKPSDLQDVIADVETVVHLAAILPPHSERNREQTFRVNVEGTETLLHAVRRHGADPHLVFASSVVVYGACDQSDAIVSTSHTINPSTIYAESKVAAEHVVKDLVPSATIARISGVAVAAVLEPPEPWPFTSEQRMEFVLAEDVADAIVRLAGLSKPEGHVVHVSGGESWRITGQRYARDYLEALGLPADIATYLENSQAFAWYEPSPLLYELGFEPTAYSVYMERVRLSVKAFMAEAEG